MKMCGKDSTEKVVTGMLLAFVTVYVTLALAALAAAAYVVIHFLLKVW
jgi:hypothetical protein